MGSFLEKLRRPYSAYSVYSGISIFFSIFLRLAWSIYWVPMASYCACPEAFFHSTPWWELRVFARTSKVTYFSYHCQPDIHEKSIHFLVEWHLEYNKLKIQLKKFKCLFLCLSFCLSLMLIFCLLQNYTRHIGWNLGNSILISVLQLLKLWQHPCILQYLYLSICLVC